MALVSLKIGAGDAYREIGKVERAMRKLFKSQKGQVRYTEPLRKVIARSVALQVEGTQQELLVQTPEWSGFMVSNWKLSQGRVPQDVDISKPADTEYDVVVSPQGQEYELPVRGQFEPFEPVDLGSIDGTKYQVIYNNTAYGEELADGIGPSRDGVVQSGGGPDWFHSLGQLFTDENTYKRYLRQAKKDLQA